MTGSDEDRIAEFDERYRIVGEPAMLRAEQRVIGADYGATSYTTRAQADRLAALHGLMPGMVLLDVGSGAGWPGVYLADTTGCRVVLSDLPLEGLRVASRRIERDGVAAAAVAATGTALPFRDDVFDAVTSSEAFC